MRRSEQKEIKELRAGAAKTRRECTRMIFQSRKLRAPSKSSVETKTARFTRQTGLCNLSPYALAQSDVGQRNPVTDFRYRWGIFVGVGGR